MSLGASVLIGSSGQVARSLAATLKKRGAPLLQASSSNSPGSVPLDLANADSVRAFFREAETRYGKKPLEVFLAGAMTHVDRCEEERDRCRLINEEGPGVVAGECAARGHKLTYFSTEYVFGEAEYHGGAVGPFSESDPPAPTSFYGQCKLGGEKRIQEILGLEGALILRTTMVYSWDPKGNNFLMQYLRQLEEIRAGHQPPVFKIPEDQVSTPAYAPALAEAACLLREKGAGGIFNLVGPDLLSRRQLVERVIHAFGFDAEKSLAGFRFLKTAELGQKARRPLTAGLTMDKAKSFGVAPRSLESAFAEIQALRRNS